MTEVEILGIAQDGGIPHLGCSCQNCHTTKHNVASLLLKKERTILVDATPDISAQLGSHIPDAILITHLHIGHYVGLLQLGREVADLERVPVYTTAAVAEFLRENRPFSHLVGRGNIELVTLRPGESTVIGGVEICPFLVPHRNEDGDTIGIHVGDAMTYVPDIDYLTDEIVEFLRTSELVLFDGTFFRKDEIGRQREVPHPPVEETMEMVGEPRGQFYFTHINHTNPLLDRSSKEYREVISRGFGVAEEGQRFRLGP